jgi:hypothetical protein
MKKFFRGLASVLLKLSLFNLAVFTAIVLALGNPANIKESLAESNIYTTIVDSILDASQNALKDRPSENGESFPINQPEIRAAANKAFPPEFLQKNVEQVIDGTFGWLDGKTSKPSWKIDLTEAKQTLANGVGDYAKNRFNGLPVCTLQQLQEAGGEVDALSAPCRPPGLTADAVRQDVINDLANSKEFLGDTVITPETLAENNEDGDPFEKFAGAPDALQQLRLGPWVLAIFSLLLAAAVVLLHDHKRQGIRSVAITTAGTGLFLLIGTLILTYLFKQMNAPGGNIAKAVEGDFQQSALSVINSLQATVNRYVLYFSGGYIAGGGLTLLGLHFTKPKAPEITKSVKEKSVITEASAPPEKAKSKPSISDAKAPEPTGPPPLKKQ